MHETNSWNNVPVHTAQIAVSREMSHELLEDIGARDELSMNTGYSLRGQVWLLQQSFNRNIYIIYKMVTCQHPRYGRIPDNISIDHGFMLTYMTIPEDAKNA